MTAVPGLLALTSPLSFTTATDSSLLLQVIVSFFGAFVFSCFDSALFPVIYSFIYSSLTDTSPSITVTAHFASTPFAVAVMVAVPVFLPVILPFFTLAIELSVLDQTTFLLAPVISGTSLTELPAPFVLRRTASIFSASALSRTVSSHEDD